MVNLLDRFEQSFERLMEGSIGRLFRSPIQPAEIGRKLERAMVSNQVTSVDATLVPNDYRVAMHPQDMVLFVDYVTGLCRQMEAWLTELATDRSFTLIDRVRVQIAGDAGVPRRAIQVTAAIADRPEMGVDQQDAVQRTEVYRVIRETTGIPPLRIKFVDGPQRGEEMLVRKPVTTVGRALDNDIVLESGDVSRHHARIEFADAQMRVVDLNSTNGTRVNGRSVRAHPVAAGDEVTFGTLSVQVLPFDPAAG
ncbi:MAG: Forkhead-associated [uncultured Thermomicrobiales bacterium]|uniref:Forkhead-associated n=1 Tax=uncultured Thermomicrobiales bacterium TaxID=1645740 RepID=A0A6J4UQU1_9BACT|nr:MAG: Forkhead-associated [uncultured Thermomicrobiales bacterium]